MKTIFKPCNILLPNVYANMEKWAVVACDQFTSEEKYWESLKKYIGDEPSSLNLIFPEAYLNKINTEEKIKEINNNMNMLLKSNFFSEYKKSFVLVERYTEQGTRYGLVGAIDLEEYDYSEKSTSYVRATEKTVESRLPVRVKIRENAPLELSHIMLLINDDKKTVIEELARIKYSFKKIYDFELNKNGGYVKGYLINDRIYISSIIEKMNNLIKDDIFALVGDGNHSLASAKMHWENIKSKLSDEKRENHSARYALVEIENIFDDSLHFEPIHRLILGAKGDFLIKLKQEIKGDYISKAYEGSECLEISMNPNAILALKDIQNFIDKYKGENEDIKIDYIHGEDSLKRICAEKNGIGIVLPKLNKNDFFEYASKNGIMPKKTFSIGEANEKRYYIEARKIK